jgi:beta-phosphoglucomutase-like phosphatase (HAD superfamily)
MGYEPADCVVIEDSRIGVEAAKRGGFDVCMYAKEKATDHGSLKGVTVFDNMAELDLLLSP